MNKTKEIILRHTKYFVIAGIFLLITTVMLQFNPLIIQFTMDVLEYGEENVVSNFVVLNLLNERFEIRNNLWILSILFIFIAFIRAIFIFLRGKYSLKGAEKICYDLRNDMYDHIQNLPFTAHSNLSAGELIQKCTKDIDNVKMFFSFKVLNIFRILFSVGAAMYFMFMLNTKYALYSIIVFPFIILVTFFSMNKIRVAFQKKEKIDDELLSALTDNINGVRVVKAFGRQKFEVDRFDKFNKDAYESNYNLRKIYARFRIVVVALGALQQTITLLLGISLVLKGEISIGTLMAFNSYVIMIIMPIRELAQLVDETVRIRVTLKRIDDVFVIEREKESEKALTPDINGDIVFDNVVLEYNDDGTKALNGISFTIKKGETVAILGKIGSGKSSLVSLLLALFDYTSGSIKINNVELRDISKKHLRENIGIVLQEPYLYARTIEENIKMAKNNSTQKEMLEATSIASIHNTIENFDKGYNTILGEKGVTLSGGQKQRVAIARTLMENYKVLIFDDSLSALDTQTDKEIRQKLENINKDTTTIIISQRISTLKDADKILVIEDGLITDVGTHDELVNSSDLYSKIWNIQNMISDEEMAGDK